MGRIQPRVQTPNWRVTARLLYVSEVSKPLLKSTTRTAHLCGEGWGGHGTSVFGRDACGHEALLGDHWRCLLAECSVLWLSKKPVNIVTGETSIDKCRRKENQTHCLIQHIHLTPLAHFHSFSSPPPQNWAGEDTGLLCLWELLGLSCASLKRDCIEKWVENKYYIKYHHSPLVLDFPSKTCSTFLPLTYHLYSQLLLGWLHQYFSCIFATFLCYLLPQTSCQ